MCERAGLPGLVADIMCYRDMSFCSASHECGNTFCRRRFTDETQKAVDEWWGKPGGPVAYAEYKDGPACVGFQEIET